MDKDNRYDDILSDLNNSEYGPKAMIKKGKHDGQSGEPLASHEGLNDGEELCVKWHEDKYDITKQDYEHRFAEIDPRLLEQESDMLAISPENHLALTEAENRFSDIIENHRTNLTTYGEVAKKSKKNLKDFKNKHKLKQKAEHTNPEKYLRNSIIIILSHVLPIGISMCALLAYQDGSSTLKGTLATVVPVITINSVLGIASAEAWRAWKHNFKEFRIGSVLILIATAVLAVILNLSSGHYRDALDPDFPAYESNTANAENSGMIPIDKCTRVSLDAGDGSLEDQPSREALCLLTSRPFSFNEFHSVVHTLLGFILFLSISWWWWKNDHWYFMYGAKSRKNLKHRRMWDNARNEVITLLQTQCRELISGLEQSRDEFHTILITDRGSCTKSLRTITNSCEKSIYAYRKANRGVRPRLVNYPAHWDKQWKAPWNEGTPEQFENLPPEKEVRMLVQKYNEVIDMVINAIYEKHKNYRSMVDDFGPKIKQ